MSLRVAFLALAAGACEASQELEFQLIHAILRGSVVTDSGTPVGGVEIEVSSILEDIPGQGCVDPPFQVYRTSTTADGSFEVVLDGRAGLSRQDGCVDIVGTAPAAAGLKPDTLRGVPVVFRREPALDTVTVQLVLERP